MKIEKSHIFIIIFFPFVLIIAQSVRYLDIMVSVKYETQLEGLVEITKDIQTKTDERVLELENSKKNIEKTILILVIFLTLIFIFLALMKKNTKSKQFLE